MKGLLLKDYYLLLRSCQPILLMMLIFAVIFIPQTGPSGFLPLCALLSALMIIPTFSYDESAKWDIYALVTPVSRAGVVAAKYLMLFLLSIAGLITGLIFCVIATLLFQTAPLNSSELLFSSLLYISAALLVGSVFLPLLYKFGPEKGRMLLICCAFLPALLSFARKTLFPGLTLSISDSALHLLLSFLPAIALAIYLLSYRLSLGIYRKKDF